MIAKALLISSPALMGGSILFAGYLHKPESIDLSRDEYLNAMKSERVWTEKDTQELLDKLEEFNKDLCKTYELLYAMVPTKEAIQQAKTIDQIPQLQLYRKLASELEKKEWGILPIVIAVDSGYTYPLFVEVDAGNPTNTSTMKIRSVYSEPWLADLLWNMRVYTQILPKCSKYYSNEIIRAFEISAEPPPEHKPNSDNNNQNNSQQQNTQQNTSNNTNSNTSSVNNTNNTNNSSINQNQNKSENTKTTTKHAIKNQDNFDEEFKKRQEEFERERREFEKKFNEEWERFNQEFSNQQQHH
jgi:hypothetical protein